VAVVDVSASIGQGPLAPPEEARIDAEWVAVAETVRRVKGRASAPGVAREGTRLAEAVRWAAAEYPGRDLWIFTDGRSTDGPPEQAAGAVRAAGGRVWVSAPARPAADVGLLEARVRRPPGGGTEVLVTVGASTAGRARVMLTREGREIDVRPVDLEPGARQTLVLRDPDAVTGATAYGIRLEPARGTPNDDPENDRLAVGVQASRRTVLVWGDLPSDVWSAQDLPFDVRQMTQYEAGALAAADCVVVSSLPWSRIGKSRVRDLLGFVAGGGRLLLLGGPRSWRAGGWAGTALEDELAGLRVPREEGQGLALLLAVDTSGSTSHGARDHLLRAVSSVIDDLRPGEQAAVLPFDARPAQALLPPGWLRFDAESDAREALTTELSRIVPGGGTDIPAAVLAAAGHLQATDARSRRVLLLTDGDPDTRPDEATLTSVRRELQRLGVEFSALVSGMREAVEDLRRHLAVKPENVRLLSSVAEIPAFVLHEVARMRGEEEEFPMPAAIRWTDPALEDRGLAELRPRRLQDLERAPEGRVVAEAVWEDDGPDPRPFAALRRVGAGEVLSLAWGPAWEEDPASGVRQLAALVAGLAEDADRGMPAEIIGADLVVRLAEREGAGRLAVRGPGLEAELIEVAPGLFRGPVLQGVEPGACVCVGDGADGLFDMRPLRLPARPEPEHRGVGIDESALRELARAGGGARLLAGQVPPPGRRGDGPPLAPWLLLIAVILVIVDRGGTEARGLDGRSSEEGGSS
jgi:hypothetical protein